MMRSWLLIFLLGSLTWAQAQSQAAPQSTQGARRSAGEDDDYQPPQAPATNLPMDAVVLTIKDFARNNNQPPARRARHP